MASSMARAAAGFYEMARGLLAAFRPRVRDLRVPHTTCNATAINGPPCWRGLCSIYEQQLRVALQVPCEWARAGSNPRNK